MDCAITPKTSKERYSHFNERLAERYGLSISFTEYMVIEPRFMYRSSANSNIVALTIQGIEVIAAVTKGGKYTGHLRTALPMVYDFEFYLPSAIRRILSERQIWDEVIRQDEICQHAVAAKLSLKELFTTFPVHIAHRVKHWDTAYDLCDRGRFFGSVCYKMLNKATR